MDPPRGRGQEDSGRNAPCLTLCRAGLVSHQLDRVVARVARRHSVSAGHRSGRLHYRLGKHPSLVLVATLASRRVHLSRDHSRLPLLDPGSPREDADAILRIGMQEFGIDGTTVAAIYSAVRAAGGGAWNSNAELKRQGERRILRVFPADPRTRWEDWKKRSDVFEPQ